MSLHWLFNISLITSVQPETVEQEPAERGCLTLNDWGDRASPAEGLYIRVVEF